MTDQSGFAALDATITKALEPLYAESIGWFAREMRVRALQWRIGSDGRLWTCTVERLYGDSGEVAFAHGDKLSVVLAEAVLLCPLPNDEHPAGVREVPPDTAGAIREALLAKGTVIGHPGGGHSLSVPLGGRDQPHTTP